MKFIHTADLHLDSPLRGLSSYPDAPAERLRTATRDAFHNLVTHAIDDQVDFMVIAGDVADLHFESTLRGLSAFADALAECLRSTAGDTDKRLSEKYLIGLDRRNAIRCGLWPADLAVNF